MTKRIFLIIAFLSLSTPRRDTVDAAIGADFDGDELDGPNICTKLESFPIEVITTELQSYQERATVWCFEVPPKCTQYRIKHRVVNKTHNIIKTRVVRECCEGFKRNRKGNGCIPQCDQDCHNGECVAPNKCKCNPGYGGPTCEVNCPLGYWGHNCEKQCDCANNAGCDPSSGACRCSDDYTGEKCEDKKCPRGFFGAKCDQICKCANKSACEKVSGDCICSSGYTGTDCSTPCSDGFYGVNCQEQCPEVERAKSCDHVTGALLCEPGYIGIACEHPCPSGFYGAGCTEKCGCKNGGDCDHVTGECSCTPGWIGTYCNQSCPHDLYGKNCSEVCQCKNHEACRKTDGLCICKAGWMGNTCDQVCPEGFYGTYCLSSCSCAKNFICHPAKGCVCRQGFTGKHCDAPSVSEHVQKAEADHSNTGLILTLTLILLTVGIVLVILYYRRRVSNLKTEIHHVQYISDVNRPEAHNFDNPVYAVYGPQNNEASLLNNLDSNKFYMDKNLDADLTNPNIIYHSIEDTKKEHVYDEIKPNKGNNPDEYDHLDYTGPSTSQKPHYHHLANGSLAMANVAGTVEEENGSEETCDSICDNTNYSPVGSPCSSQKYIN